jgi:hypothetical protein
MLWLLTLKTVVVRVLFQAYGILQNSGNKPGAGEVSRCSQNALTGDMRCPTTIRK